MLRTKASPSLLTPNSSLLTNTMARTIQEIKKTMTDQFMADPTIREKYQLREDDTFQDAFSAVSIENIIFYIVAACCHVIETLLDQHIATVEKSISQAVVASIPWYHKIAMQFQYGDSLTYDEQTCQYRYKQENPEKQIIKYAALRDRGSSIQILVATEKDGLPQPLSDTHLTAFKHYMNSVKIAGTNLNIQSLPPDQINIQATITIAPLTIGENGQQISDNTYPAEQAIHQYLKNIIYGGTFNKNKLIDALQNTPGIIDIQLQQITVTTDQGKTYHTITSNNYTAQGGSLIPIGLRNSLTYQTQIS